MGGNGQRNSKDSYCREAEISICAFHIFEFDWESQYLRRVLTIKQEISHITMTNRSLYSCYRSWTLVRVSIFAEILAPLIYPSRGRLQHVVPVIFAPISNRRRHSHITRIRYLVIVNFLLARTPLRKIFVLVRRELLRQFLLWRSRLDLLLKPPGPSLNPLSHRFQMLGN